MATLSSSLVRAGLRAAVRPIARFDVRQRHAAARGYRHPLIRLAGTVARLPRYLNLAQGLARESVVAAQHKAALGLGIGYAVLPFDLIPGVIPVLGQLDDLAALLLGIRHTLRACPPDVAAAHLERVGLKQTALDDDLRTVAVVTVWLVAGAASLGARAARAPGRLMARVCGKTAPSAVSGE